MAEWSNVPDSKSGVRAIVPWVRIPPLPPCVHNQLSPRRSKQYPSLRIAIDLQQYLPGGHILTGPIAVEGAEPGDTLEIRILKIDLAIPYAYNGFGPAAGILRDDFPYRRTKIIPLDREKMVITRIVPTSRSTMQ